MIKKILTLFALLTASFTSPSGAEEYGNIVVYYVSEIVDGDAYASPIGIIPRFDNEYVAKIKETHKPENLSYITEVIDDRSVILFWRNDGIEAINFISEDEARSFPNFEPFPAEDLNSLDKALKHFPRR